MLEKVRRGDMSVRDVLARMQPSHTVSITDYIQQSKLERAKYLLANSQTTVDEISDSPGFGTRSYFTSVFKKHTGQTPSDYRKEHSLV